MELAFHEMRERGLYSDLERVLTSAQFIHEWEFRVFPESLWGNERPPRRISAPVGGRVLTRNLRLAAIAVLLLTLSGCQEQFSSSSSELCSSVKVGEKFLIGEVITAPQTRSVTIRDVAFTGAKGVVLVSSFLLDIRARNALGNSPYPPPAWPAWEDRVAANGATLTPGVEKNLVVVIRRDSQEAGHADALEVTYFSVGKQYREPGGTRYVFADACP